MKNLAYVVNRVQLDLNDFSSHSVSRITQFAIHCVKHHLRFKTNKSVKVAYVTPNAAGNAPMPMDMEKYLKVGISLCGQIYTLTVNNDLLLARTYECGVEQEPQSIEACLQTPDYEYPDGFWYAPHYRAGQYVGEMYSQGGGLNAFGYFRADYEQRQFQFSNVPVTEIIIEYVADEDVNSQTLIPYQCVDTILNYVHWKMIAYDRTVGLGEKQLAQNAFTKSMADLTYLTFAPNISEYLDMSYSSYKSSPKR